MRGWIIFLSLCAFVLITHQVSVLGHNLEPSLRVVEKRVSLTNLQVKELGYRVADGRKYFRKIVYEERRQTKGLRTEVRRDTISNDVLYEDDK